MARKKRSRRVFGQDDSDIEYACTATGQNSVVKRRSRRTAEKNERHKILLEKENVDSTLLCLQERLRAELLLLSRVVAGNGYAKEWNPIFSTSRPPERKVSESWVKSKRKCDAMDDNGIDLLLRDAEDCEALYYFNEVREYCQGVNLEALKSGWGTAGHKRAAWLDMRVSTQDGCVGRYQNPLTAKSLYCLLKGDPVGVERVLM
jgi:hypothetical protein